jgi:hypothetical protein
MKHRAPATWFPVVSNYRGKPVGVWLGVAFTVAVVGWISVVALASALGDAPMGTHVRRASWMSMGCACVFLAGLYDDFRPAPSRGLVSQVRALFQGRLTAGMVKLAVITASSGVLAWALGARGGRLVLGTIVVAGSADIWNLLDVVPGRAIKFFVPAVAALIVAAGGAGYETLGAVALGAALAALYFDLGERAMLGDAGANVLGFVVGVGLLEALSIAGLAVAAVIVGAVHVASETVTLSRIIRAVPALRWFDDLGRIRVESENERPEIT